MTVKFYVNDSLVRQITITDADIQGRSLSNKASVGDGTVGDTMWGSGKPPLKEISPLRGFQKWISLGKKGQKYYYTIETNGKSQRYELDTSVAYYLPESQASRLQSTS